VLRTKCLIQLMRRVKLGKKDMLMMMMMLMMMTMKKKTVGASNLAGIEADWTHQRQETSESPPW